MKFSFNPYEIIGKSPSTPAKLAKPAKPGVGNGEERANFSNISNFSKPIPGFDENSEPAAAAANSPADNQPAYVESPGLDDAPGLDESEPSNVVDVPPASSTEIKSLHEIMWPTPPMVPQPAPVEAPGPDIAQLVSGWPRHLRLEYAGRVGRYSNAMNLEAAMAKAFGELKDYPQGG